MAVYPPAVRRQDAGLGGRDVTPEDVTGIIEDVWHREVSDGTSVFWGLKE
ncbi:MAG: hypothetical protein JRI76_03625 [Deltaproteobacteria bacterium]|nr:hypothetical protein [Deltaproteobacteria bacterium]MBW2041103.1 hypothetical protein [Deltaproteobacteria bacterium]MBW2132251.1 hypothetical protein [Deltaproteobacteria bacterium]